MAQHFTLQPLLHADISVVSKITADAFLVDRHTVMKGLGKTPYNMEEISRSGLANLINSEKCVCMKAVHNETGEILGWGSWGFRGFEPGEAPRLSATEQEFDPRDKPVWKDEKAIANEKAKADAAAGQKTNDNATTEKPAAAADDDDDIIKRLNAMEDEDMTQWMKKLMPEGTKCMFVVSFSVAPKFQKQGVGAALLKWGTDVADRFQVFAWVHSSVPAYKAYEKAGFETIGTLDLDLDEWAPAPPPKEEGEGAIWGRYLIRYMKRLPKKPE